MRPPVRATGVCVCSVSPLRHSLAPVFLQVRTPGRLAVGASEALVTPAWYFAPGSALEQRREAVRRLLAHARTHTLGDGEHAGISTGPSRSAPRSEAPPSGGAVRTQARPRPPRAGIGSPGALTWTERSAPTARSRSGRQDCRCRPAAAGVVPVCARPHPTVAPRTVAQTARDQWRSRHAHRPPACASWHGPASGGRLRDAARGLTRARSTTRVSRGPQRLQQQDAPGS